MLGILSGGWLMWGQISDARERAESAELRSIELGKQFEEMAARQAQTDASLATRRRQSDALSAQLGRLRSDLDRITRDDEKASVWAAGCLPGAVADRMRLPADQDCDPSR
ncbi:hypothetical protein D3C78_1530260 [compost metagenome]